MNNQRYIDFNILYQYVLNARRIYQELIMCVTSIAKNFRNYNDNDENEYDFKDEEGVLNEILLIATHTNLKIKGFYISKFMIIIIKDKKKKIKEKDKKKIKNNKFEKLFKLFNIYVGFHFVNNVREYAMMMNSNVLIKKLKHKLICLLNNFFYIAKQY